MTRRSLPLAVLAWMIVGAQTGQAAQLIIPPETAAAVQRVSQSTGGVIGVALTQLTSEVRSQLNYQGPAGAVIVKVLSGYPADKAGLSPGDVIASANVQLILSPNDFTRLVSMMPAGASVTLDVWSGHSHKVVVVNVVERSQASAQQVARAPSDVAPTGVPSAAISTEPAPSSTARPLFAEVPVMFPDYKGRVVTSQGKPSDVRLRQLLTELQKAPGSIAIHERIAAQVGKMNPKPGVPESARMYYVQAAYLEKTAKTSIDYGLAIEDYKKAISLAPWWADAYYGLGSALKATQQYPDALECLKLSLLANPHGPHARAIQNEVYIVQAEQQKTAAAQAEAAQAAATQTRAAAAQEATAAKAAAAQAAAAQAAAMAKRARYEHEWKCHSTNCSSLRVNFSEDGPFDAYITGALTGVGGTLELHGTMDGNDISGAALVPGGDYDSRTGCTTPKTSQSTFTGKLSEDGLTLNLTVMLPVFQGQSTETTVLHRAVFGPECAGITQTGSNPATIVLVAQ